MITYFVLVLIIVAIFVVNLSRDRKKFSTNNNQTISDSSKCIKAKSNKGYISPEIKPVEELKDKRIIKGDPKNFIALDLETATSDRSSICQFGITEVIDGIPQEPKSWLIRPKDNKYFKKNIKIHGITPEDTESSPSFLEVWAEVLPYLQDKIVVAHNTSFDMYALRDALNNYGIEYPNFDYFCTYRISKDIVVGCENYTLDTICNYLEIDFGKHHRADSDSLGCALLLLKCFEIDGSATFEDLEKKYTFCRGKFAPGVFESQHKGFKYSVQSYNKPGEIVFKVGLTPQSE